MTEKFEEIGLYYDGLVKRYGHDSRSCDYGNPESQKRKFDVLSEGWGLDGCSVLDVGCGFADFADYLKKSGKRAIYTGLDLSACMVEKARQLHPSLDIRQGNVLTMRTDHSFDVVVANGIFYLLGNDAESCMAEIVRRLWSLCGCVLVFNSLSSWAADPVDGEFYADPMTTIDFCRKLTPWIVFRHDYHHRDFTVYLYRERQV